MNILKYNGYTEIEIFNLIVQVRNNNNEALEKLINIFKNKIYIKDNPNYDNELLSFFYELLLKIPLDNIISKHKLINYIFSSLKKKKSKIFKAQANSSIKLTEDNPKFNNLIITTSHDSINELVTLKISLSNLSIDEKALLSLYYKYGYTEEEIGKFFNGITRAAISKRKKNIIKKLKENF